MRRTEIKRMRKNMEYVKKGNRKTKQKIEYKQQRKKKKERRKERF